MRDSLIKKTIEVSYAVDQDMLEFVNWNTKSNDEILEMYVELRIADYLQTHTEAIKKWYCNEKWYATAPE